jgi:integrase
MAVQQKPDGRWIVRYTPGTNTDDPKRTVEYFGRGLQAEKAARERNAALGLGRYKKRTPKYYAPTFAEIAAEYYNARSPRMAAATSVAFFYKLTAVYLPAFGSIPCDAITDTHIDRYVEKRLQDPVTVRRGKGGTIRHVVNDPDGTPRRISPTTVHRELSDIFAILNWAAKKRLIAVNPVAGYAKPFRRDRLVLPPTSTEIQAIFAAASPHLKRFLAIAYYSGSRPGETEILSMTWRENVFLDRDLLVVVSARKGGPAHRVIPIRAEFHSMLREWKAADDADGVPWLVHYKGRPIKRIKTAFRGALRRAGITRRLRPYDFRHEFVSRLLNSGQPLKVVSDMAGHSRTETTTRIYQHVDLDAARAVIESDAPVSLVQKRIAPESAEKS